MGFARRLWSKFRDDDVLNGAATLGFFFLLEGVFAIYEPHQAEETISYLIVGDKRALLFDTGMGISDLKKVIAQLTKLPIILLNSHTHNDHVGDNWEFSRIYGMDTDFTRQNARGSRARCAGRNHAQPDLWRAADGI